MARCSYCGADISPIARTCPQCGDPTKERSSYGSAYSSLRSAHYGLGYAVAILLSLIVVSVGWKDDKLPWYLLPIVGGFGWLFGFLPGVILEQYLPETRADLVLIVHCLSVGVFIWFVIGPWL